MTTDSSTKVPSRPLLVLPYLADYRVGFVNYLTAHYPNLHVAHPPAALDPTVHTTRVANSTLLPPMKHMAGGAFRRQPGLLRLLRDVDPTAVVLEADTRVLDYLLALCYCRLTKTPAHVWSLGAAPRRRHLVERVAGRIVVQVQLFLASGIIGKGPHGTEYFKTRSLGLRRTFRTSWNTTALATEMIESPGFEEHDPFSLLYVGRITDAKRLDWALAGLAALGDDRFTLTLVGEGPAASNLRALAHRLGIQERVRFAGRQTGTKLIHTYQKAGAFLLPGSGGLAVTEALAAGLPCILGARGAVGDGTVEHIVRNGHQGYFAADATSKAYADTLRRYRTLILSGEYHEFSQRATATFNLLFSQSKLISPFVDAFGNP